MSEETDPKYDPKFQGITGMMLAMNAIVSLARQKGLFTEMEIDVALESAEDVVTRMLADGDEAAPWRRAGHLPIRFLRAMNRRWIPGSKPSDEALAAYLRGQEDHL